MKHSLYSAVASVSLKESIAAVQQGGVDLMDLSPEAVLLKAMLREFVRKQEGLADALQLWADSFAPDFQMMMASNDPVEIATAVKRLKDQLPKRPREALGLSAAAQLAENVGKMVERIHRIKQTSAVTWEAVSILLERMGMVLLKHGREADGAPFNWAAFWAKVENDWSELDVPLSTSKR